MNKAHIYITLISGPWVPYTFPAHQLHVPGCKAPWGKPIRRILKSAYGILGSDTSHWSRRFLPLSPRISTTGIEDHSTSATGWRSESLTIVRLGLSVVTVYRTRLCESTIAQFTKWLFVDFEGVKRIVVEVEVDQEIGAVGMVWVPVANGRAPNEDWAGPYFELMFKSHPFDLSSGWDIAFQPPWVKGLLCVEAAYDKGGVWW